MPSSPVDWFFGLDARVKQMSWTEARSKLEKDALGRASNPDIDTTERERIFRVHIDGLYNVCF